MKLKKAFIYFCLSLLLAQFLAFQTAHAEETLSLVQPQVTQNLASKNSVYEARIYLPGIQLRFEDSDKQARELQSYDYYTVQLAYDYWIVGLEYAQKKNVGGNATLSVAQTRAERGLILGKGFNLFTQNTTSTPLLVDVFGVFYLGQVQTQVQTQILSQTESENTQYQTTQGLGVEAQIKIGYVGLSVDSRLMTSRGYSPQVISVSTLKLGALIPF